MKLNLDFIPDTVVFLNEKGYSIWGNKELFYQKRKSILDILPKKPCYIALKDEKIKLFEDLCFKDPIAVKKQDRPDKPKNGKPDVWNYAEPQYDQRHSRFINAGVDYGIGHRQPVGHEGNGTMNGVPRGTKKAEADKY